MKTVGFVRAAAVWSRASGAQPACEGVDKQHLRGASLTSRMAIEVMTRCARAAGADPSQTPTLVASNLGEIQTAVALLAMMEGEGLPSPIRFKNSVHNAAAGLFGVAFANRRFSTALSAGEDLVAMALVEAAAWLASEGGEILVALSEEDVPAPLDRGEPGYAPLAVGLLLCAEGAAGDLALRDLRRDPSLTPDVDVGYRGNVVAPALGLASAFDARATEAVPLGGGWAVDVAPWSRR